MKNKKNKKEDKKDSYIIQQCRRYDISIWEHPQFIFSIMGIIIMISIVSIYLIGTRYLIDTEAILIFLFSITIILLIISFAISRSFEKMAEANRTKSELLRVVTHHLNTPLASLKWMYDSLFDKENILTDNQSENIAMMKKSIDEMIKTTGNLSLASRIERKKLFTVKKETSLEDLIHDAVKTISSLSGIDNLDISIDKKDEIPLIFIDPVQLKWVIENLIDNSIKYSSYNKDKVKIEIKIKKDKKNRIIFEIKDNGMGILKNDQKYVFTKFFRGKNALKYNIPGIGLSLFACKLIIKEFKGEMEFESRENHGSKFRFTLPVGKK